VAVVGGGYTGLWTALAVREREPAARIVVLEAETCGAGPSGRNGGFCHGYWSYLATMREVLGDARALEVARAGERIIPAVRAFDGDFWLREGGLLRVSAAPAQDAAVDRAVEAAQELGVEEEAVPLSREELAAQIRSPVFRKGVYFRECATVQPARLVRALRAAVLPVAELHERTAVTRIEPGVLTTPRGRVHAPEIVVATNAWMTGWRPLRGRDGRVLMGSGSGPIGYGGRIDERFSRDRATAARAAAGLRRLLPDLAEARIERAWGGPIDVSSDHLPFFGTVPGERVHYGAGYSGHGVGPSWLGGQILASLATGRDDEWTALPLATRRVPRLPPEPLTRIGGGLVRAAIMACEAAEERGRHPPLAARAGAALPRLLRMQIGTR
jgi:glycine/D-amino acid oxidase-like deaminating enzyme